jgi:hypothetical protein
MVDRFNIPHIRVLNSIRFRGTDVKRLLEESRGQEAARRCFASKSDAALSP